jgi:hypothetical protein
LAENKVATPVLPVQKIRTRRQKMRVASGAIIWLVGSNIYPVSYAPLRGPLARSRY